MIQTVTDSHAAGLLALPFILPTTALAFSDRRLQSANSACRYSGELIDINGEDRIKVRFEARCCDGTGEFVRIEQATRHHFTGTACIIYVL